MIAFILQLVFQLIVASVRLAALVASLVAMALFSLMKLLWRSLRQVDWSRVRASAVTPPPHTVAEQRPKNRWLGGPQISPPVIAVPTATAPASAPAAKRRAPQPLRPPPWAGR